MAERFAHLHLHTDRSMLDGVGTSNEYAALAAEAGHTHLAITDHGNLYGLPEHRRACERVGVKPVFGCELYINDDRSRTVGLSKEKKKEAAAIDPTFVDAHIVAICLDNTGWKNLLKVNHDSVVNGYHYHPRTETDFLLAHSDGLAITTACLGSQFGKLAAAGDVKRLRALLGKYKDALGDRFFVEVHINELELQRRVNSVLLREAISMGITPILTSDVHYACADDARLQDQMVSIARHTPLDDPKAFKLEARHLYYSTVDEAVRLARDLKTGLSPKLVRSAAENSFLLATRSDADIYPTGGVLSPPRYIRPDGKETTDPYRDLVSSAVSGFKENFARVGKEKVKVYTDRLRRELDVINRCGMSDFYLVTADVAREAARRGIFMWTRGSGCASLVAAAIGITRVDPVRFDLLFERFVDPSRPNAPDFDLDIDSGRRAELVEWFAGKYGGKDRERIARISALSTFGIKAAIRDVCHAVGGDSSVASKVAAASDNIPPTVEASLSNATSSERVAAIANAEVEFRKVLPADVADSFFVAGRQAAIDALTMVGRVRGRTQHAAGYVVAPGPLSEYVPIDKIGSGDKSVIVSAWGEGQAMQDIAETGLMKIDFLGLEACRVISDAANLIAARNGSDVATVFAGIDGLSMNFSDKRVLAEYAMGDGVGLHQLATQDRRLARIVQRLKPRNVADLAAAIALYRPGSMSHVDEFVDRSRGVEPVPLVHPKVDEILSETYGIPVYQEQVMKLLNVVGGIPLRKAYEIIKAIAKKRLDKIKSARDEFVKGSSSSGLSPVEANRIFGDVENFAGYGFNKAHAVSYAVLSWITAHIRAYYPTEFWCALLNSTDNETVSKGKKETERKIEVVMRAATKSGVRLLPPTIAGSSSRWVIVEDKKLLAPLSIAPGVGADAAERIHEAHKSSGFRKLADFLSWADKNKKSANSKVVSALGNCGAWGGVGVPITAARDIAAVWSSASGKSRLKALRDTFADGAVIRTRMDDEIAMSIEKSGLGFNFWHSPWSVNDRSGKVERLRSSGKSPLAGDTTANGKRYPFVVTSIRRHTDRRGKEMAFVGLSDPEGENHKGVCFASVWSECENLVVGSAYLVSGNFDRREGSFMIQRSGTSHSPFRRLDDVQC